MKKRIYKTFYFNVVVFSLLILLFPTVMSAAVQPKRYLGTNPWGSRIYGQNWWGGTPDRELFSANTYTSANNAATYVRANGRVGASYTSAYRSKNWDTTSKGKDVQAGVYVLFSESRGGFLGTYSEHSHYDHGTDLYEIPGRWR